MAMRGTPGVKEYDNTRDGDPIFVVPKALFEGLIAVKNDIAMDMEVVSRKIIELLEGPDSK